MSFNFAKRGSFTRNQQVKEDDWVPATPLNLARIVPVSKFVELEPLKLIGFVNDSRHYVYKGAPGEFLSIVDLFTSFVVAEERVYVNAEKKKVKNVVSRETISNVPRRDILNYVRERIAINRTYSFARR